MACLQDWLLAGNWELGDRECSHCYLTDKGDWPIVPGLCANNVAFGKYLLFLLGAWNAGICVARGYLCHQPLTKTWNTESWGSLSRYFIHMLLKEEWVVWPLIRKESLSKHHHMNSSRLLYPSLLKVECVYYIAVIS